MRRSSSGPAARAARLQHAVRRFSRRLPRVARRAVLQDRVVREHRHSADSPRSGHRQADDRLDRHGDGSGAGRERARRARSGVPRPDPAQVHQHLPGIARTDEPADDPAPANAVRLRSRVVRPHRRHRRGGRQRRPGRHRRREAPHAAPRRRRSRQCLLAGAGGAGAAGGRDRPRVAGARRGDLRADRGRASIARSSAARCTSSRTSRPASC